MTGRENDALEDDFEDEDSVFDDAFAEFAAASDTNDDAMDLASDDDHDAPKTGEGEDVKKAVQAVQQVPDVASLQEKLEQQQHTLSSQVGRVSGLTKKLEEERKLREELEAKLKNVEVKKPDVNEEGMDADLDDLEEEFPEIAQAINARLKPLQAKLDKAERAAIEAAEGIKPFINEKKIAERDRQYQTLSSKHEDWREIVFGEGKAEYDAWLDKQPEPVRGLVKSTEAGDAIWLLDAFKGSRSGNKQLSEVEKINQRREKTLANAGGLQSRRVPRSPQASESDDFDSAFSEFASRANKKRLRTQALI